MTSLHPIPGTTWLYRIAPTESARPAPEPPYRPPEPRSMPTRQAAPRTGTYAKMLVTIAIEVCCGVRPVAHTRRADISTAVRATVNARHRCPAPHGPVRLASFHLTGPEIFGGAWCGDEFLGYSGRLALTPDTPARPCTLAALRVY